MDNEEEYDGYYIDDYDDGTLSCGCCSCCGCDCDRYDDEEDTETE